MKPYSKGYFENCEGSHYSEYRDWPQFRHRAKWLWDTYRPKSVLELGAAKGYLLKHLQEFGVRTKGYDISEYAASKSWGRVEALDVTRKVMDFSKYDLVVSFDFMEHVHDEDIPVLMRSLQSAKKTIPYDYDYRT